MDEADRAQARIEQELERAIAAARMVGDHKNGPHMCQECGDDIPESRRTAVPGCHFCADCATEMERMDQRARRAGL